MDKQNNTRIIVAFLQGAILMIILLKLSNLKGLSLYGMFAVLLLLIVFLEEKFIYPRIFKKDESTKNGIN